MLDPQRVEHTLTQLDYEDPPLANNVRQWLPRIETSIQEMLKLSGGDQTDPMELFDDAIMDVKGAMKTFEDIARTPVEIEDTPDRNVEKSITRASLSTWICRGIDNGFKNKKASLFTKKKGFVEEVVRTPVELEDRDKGIKRRRVKKVYFEMSQQQGEDGEEDILEGIEDKFADPESAYVYKSLREELLDNLSPLGNKLCRFLLSEDRSYLLRLMFVRYGQLRRREVLGRKYVIVNSMDFNRRMVCRYMGITWKGVEELLREIEDVYKGVVK